MNLQPINRAVFLRALLSGLCLAASFALPRAALAGAVQLATVPMATSTPTTVQPNLLFMLDDSGSMAWDYLPDVASNFANNYGFNSNQCNGVYYNPSITYSPPVNSSGGPLNATATTFSAAYKNGYNTSLGTTNLNNGFRGGSGSGSSGESLTAGPAFYYRYSGTQISPSQKNYFNTSSTFYQECNSSIGSAPGSGVFSLVRMAEIPTTTITVTSTGAPATITITSMSSSSAYSSIQVNGLEILTATTSKSSTISKVASRIASGINACTTTATGNCTTTGFSATSSGSVVTLLGPGTASGFTAVLTRSTGNAATTVTPFPTASTTNVASISVSGTNILGAPATGSGPNSLAASIAANVTATGYSATASGPVVTITAPASASQVTPVISGITSSGTAMTLTTLPFPLSDPVQLQNFANWYSYYSHRMLMMKTGAGLAFSQVSSNYRVGFMTMNNNVSPDFLGVDTFGAAQKTNWYSLLYGASPANSTPLREALSHVGQYYAHRFGNVTTYKATITVAGTSNTAVSSITVNGVELMNDTSDDDTDPCVVATNIANQINAPAVTDFGAGTGTGASCNVITITGPAAANGYTPVVTRDTGSMTFTPTAFSGTTVTAKINNVTPADPVQYSCQQNFVLLSTDGYWNGPSTYDLSNNSVGQVDGTAPRPYWDGAQSVTTYTRVFSRNDYSTTSTALSGGTNCSSCGWHQTTGCGKRTISTPQTCTMTTNGSAASSCTGTWNNSGAASYVSPYTGDNTTCVSSPTVPSPDPSVATVLSTTTTPGTTGGATNTLADVALYYYQTDLRDNSLGNCTGALGTSVCENNVFTSATDNNSLQHMTTFTLGLGVRGNMVYSPSYLTDTVGDFWYVKNGLNATATNCTWQSVGTVCNWPVPVSGNPSTVDDLWHAAVNGRGAYYSASDPNELSTGLSNALRSISSKVGAAAAAATSTLNPVAGNNQAFVASYTTLLWTGNLEARGINTDTGVVNVNDDWCVSDVAADTCAAPSTIVTDTSGDTTTYSCSTPNSVTCVDGTLNGTDCLVPMATACTGTMSALVGASSDTRTIYTANNGATLLIPFDTDYRAAHSSYFNATLLAGLTQWPPATDTSTGADYFRTNAPGDNLLGYLRGQFGHEMGRVTVPTTPNNDQFYRNRTSVMGDALESQPAFLGAPVFGYPYPGYIQFKNTQSGRIGIVYMGTNDGMMHAFNSSNGVERWAYVPSMVIPNMWKLADQNYQNLHTNYVNGSPITSDVCTANCANAVTGTSTDPVWKTILVGGLNGGGRGYYALDITDPTTPKLLWEFTTTGANGSSTDDDLGYTYGQAIVTQRTDGRWVVVVTSGYDNGNTGPTLAAQSPAGTGVGFLFVLDAGTGQILSKISTGVGTAANPSGLAKIGGFNSDPGGNKVSFIYGGDLLGNLWRFDINDPASAAIGTGSVLKFATLFADSGASVPQPIMTTPILGTILGKRVVFVGTGKYLEPSDLATTQVQTQYAIKDDNVTATIVNPRTQPTMVQQYLINNPDGSSTRLSASSSTATAQGSNTVNFGVNLGWFVDFPSSGERANIDAALIQGTLLVPTIVPASSSCSPGGFGWLNFLNYSTGASVVTPGLSGVRLDATIVGLNVLYISGNPVVEAVTSTNPTPTIVPGVQFAATAAGFAGQRVQWRELLP